MNGMNGLNGTPQTVTTTREPLVLKKEQDPMSSMQKADWTNYSSFLVMFRFCDHLVWSGYHEIMIHDI